MLTILTYDWGILMFFAELRSAASAAREGRESKTWR
jgi:hypothetical protein